MQSGAVCITPVNLVVILLAMYLILELSKGFLPTCCQLYYQILSEIKKNLGCLRLLIHQLMFVASSVHGTIATYDVFFGKSK